MSEQVTVDRLNVIISANKCTGLFDENKTNITKSKRARKGEFKIVYKY